MSEISERARELEEELTRQFRMEYTGVVDQFCGVIQAALDAERRDKLDDLHARAILTWIGYAIRGEPVSDFAESFPEVREAMDLRAARALEVEHADQAIAAAVKAEMMRCARAACTPCREGDPRRGREHVPVSWSDSEEEPLACLAVAFGILPEHS